MSPERAESDTFRALAIDAVAVMPDPLPSEIESLYRRRDALLAAEDEPGRIVYKRTDQGGWTAVFNPPAAEDEHPATPEVVERAKALLTGIAPGPWLNRVAADAEGWAGRWVTDLAGVTIAEVEIHHSTDAEFIAAAPTLVADLLALVDRPAAPVDEHPTHDVDGH